MTHNLNYTFSTGNSFILESDASNFKNSLHNTIFEFNSTCCYGQETSTFKFWTQSSKTTEYSKYNIRKDLYKI